MTGSQKKSLDDQLKEADLAIKEVELEKLKEEAALVRKQVNAKWYTGKSLAKFTGFVLTAVAVYSVVDKVFLEDIREYENRLIQLKAEVAQAALDSLNIEKKRITATIDSLKIRAIISAAFGNLDSLAYTGVLKQYKMIKTNKYFDRRLNPEGRGVENDFKIQVVRGDTVIYDAATKLTWQMSSDMSWKDALAYVDSLTYAGFDDWRLPTLKEAMSLIETRPNKRGYYIDGRFRFIRFLETESYKRIRFVFGSIWTADKYFAGMVWDVNFKHGSCFYGNANNALDVFAVR